MRRKLEGELTVLKRRFARLRIRRSRVGRDAHEVILRRVPRPAASVGDAPVQQQRLARRDAASLAPDGD